jgi:hypothetical protein
MESEVSALAMLEMRAVVLGSPVLAQTTIAKAHFDAHNVVVDYTSLPSNQPLTYANVLYMWQATAIPWGRPPYQYKAIPSDQQNGDVTISNLTISATSYVFGYASGPDPALICASFILDAGGAAVTSMSVSIGVASLTINSVTVRYSTAAGYNPNTNGNWIGLWEGQVSPYTAPIPMATARVPSTNEGTVTIPVPSGIGIHTTYTLVYFMGLPQIFTMNTTAAAILTFDSTSPGAVGA